MRANVCFLGVVALLCLSLLPQRVNGQSGRINGYEYVDLGLSVKWASCNVGASSPESYGYYYAWGELASKSCYIYSNSATYNKNVGDIGGNSRYDVARKKWGSTWRLPTKAEFDELLEECVWQWTTQRGKNGYKVTSKKNGNSIFLPAAGWYYDRSPSGVGENCFYWSSTPDVNNPKKACYLSFTRDYTRTNCDDRYRGHCVRPVTD